MSLIINPVYISPTSAWARCINPEHEDKNPSLEITLHGDMKAGVIVMAVEGFGK